MFSFLRVAEVMISLPSNRNATKTQGSWDEGRESGGREMKKRGRKINKNKPCLEPNSLYAR